MIYAHPRRVTACAHCGRRFPVREAYPLVERGKVSLLCPPCGGAIYTLSDPGKPRVARKEDNAQ